MAEFDDIAQEIIGDFVNDGLLKQITLRRVTPGAYNPTTGATTAETVVDTSVYSQIKSYDLSLIDNVFEVGDFIVELMTGTGLSVSTQLDTNDRLVIDSVVHVIVRILDKPYAVDNTYSQLVHVREY